ncbi:MAG: DUF3846 domain-containing protein, partial [Bacteroidaceae bacterium]|nr:DUF3846 domain-containing protein [Bacteroidaceae bacterium]
MSPNTVLLHIALQQVCIICNEEGKMNGMHLNRAIYAEPEEVEMSYTEMRNLF